MPTALTDDFEENLLRFMAEAFVDRAYQADGSLVPRSQPGAVLQDSGQAIAQALDIVMRQQVTTVDGQVIPLQADTLCIHGDTPQAVAFARALRAALAEIGCNWVS